MKLSRIMQLTNPCAAGGVFQKGGAEIGNIVRVDISSATRHILVARFKTSDGQRNG